VAEIDASNANSVIAQSMVYMRDSTTGSIRSMYGSQAREPLGEDFIGSYNLYLGMYNWLKVINPATSAVALQLTVYTVSGSEQQNVSLCAKCSVDLDIHNWQTYGAYRNTYGVIELSASPATGLVSELLRVRSASDGGVDFTFPTSVRDAQ
jgi:hypothetical protein